MAASYRIYDDPSEALSEDLPRYEKWQRPERCSVKASVRKGLSRSMRQVPTPTATLATHSYRRGTRKPFPCAA